MRLACSCNLIRRNGGGETRIGGPLMIMKKNIFIEIIALLLAILFMYTAASKLLEWEQTRRQLYNQPFPVVIAEMLLYILPLLEIGAVVLLLRPLWRNVGLIISTALMGAFTGYVALVMTGIFGRIPCSCGGLVASLSWAQHLILNVIFLLISVIGLTLIKRSARV